MAEPTTVTTGPVVLHGLSGLQERAGQDIGTSSWRTVEQGDIDTFAHLTGDEQWIHVDPGRAAEGPFGATVQHGFLTLGLATGLLWEVCTVDGFGVVLNYGLNKVRFPAPLRVGSRIRMHVALAEVKELAGGARSGLPAHLRGRGRAEALLRRRPRLPLLRLRGTFHDHDGEPRHRRERRRPTGSARTTSRRARGTSTSCWCTARAPASRRTRTGGWCSRRWARTSTSSPRTWSGSATPTAPRA